MTLVLALADDARACSGPPPRAEQLRWDGDALLALVAPDERLVVFDRDGARVRADLDWADDREVALPSIGRPHHVELLHEGVALHRRHRGRVGLRVRARDGA